MKKIIQNWLKGWIVILRFGGFFIVLYFLSQLIGALVFNVSLLFLLLPKDEVEKYKDIFFGGGLIISFFIFAPICFHYVSKWTGILDSESKLELYLKKRREKQ